MQVVLGVQCAWHSGRTLAEQRKAARSFLGDAFLPGPGFGGGDGSQSARLRNETAHWVR